MDFVNQLLDFIIDESRSTLILWLESFLILWLECFNSLRHYIILSRGEEDNSMVYGKIFFQKHSET